MKIREGLCTETPLVTVACDFGSGVIVFRYTLRN